jgi:ATP-dependent helicase YprA (DUF1998 family)
MEQSVENGIPTLVFSVTRQQNERFEYTVRYRLAEKAVAEKSVP